MYSTSEEGRHTRRGNSELPAGGRAARAGGTEPSSGQSCAVSAEHHWGIDPTAHGPWGLQLQGMGWADKKGVASQKQQQQR